MLSCVGIASNLLTYRLRQLIDDGLVVKREGEYAVVLYALTDLGARTRELLFELGMFGGRFQPDEELRRPGNLRTIVVTLSAACQRIVTPDLVFEAELNVDDELFALAVRDASVEMRYAPAKSPDVVMTTSYEPMIAAAEGEMPMDRFLNNHVQIITHTPGKDVELMTLLGAAMTLFAQES